MKQIVLIFKAFPESDAVDVDALCALAERWDLQPPIAFAVQFTDLWSSFEAFRPEAAPPTFVREAENSETYVWKLPSSAAEINALAAAITKRVRNDSDVERTYLRRQLATAFSHRAELVGGGFVVCRRRVLGDLVTDEEYVESYRPIRRA